MDDFKQYSLPEGRRDFYYCKSSVIEKIFFLPKLKISAKKENILNVNDRSLLIVSNVF